MRIQRYIGICFFFQIFVVGTPLPGGEIHDLIKKFDNKNAISKIEKNKKLIETVDESQMTPLYTAALCKNTEMVEYLISKKANPNAETIGGQNSISLTTDYEIAKKLIEAGCSLEHKDKYGDTPLQIALESNNKDVAKAIIEKNPVLDMRSAVYLGDLKYIENEVKKNSNILKIRTGGKSLISCKTPVGIAAEKGDLKTVKALVDLGFNLHESVYSVRADCEVTPLTNAVWFNHYEVAKYLLENGADVNVSGGYGFQTLFDFALEKWDEKMIGLLKSYKTKANDKK